MTRQEIYAAVWAQPLSRVAERLAISPGALRAACQAAQVPVPPRGYWVKASVGTGSKPPALLGRREEFFVLRKRDLALEMQPESASAPLPAQAEQAQPHEVAVDDTPDNLQVQLRALHLTAQQWTQEQRLIAFLGQVELALSRMPEPQAAPLQATLRRVLQVLQSGDPVRAGLATLGSKPA